MEKSKKKSLIIRVTPQFRQDLKIMAKESNLTVSEIVRTSIYKTKIAPNNKKDIAQLLAGINKVGNNINQIAHTLNIAKNADALSEQTFITYLKTLQNIEHRLQEIYGAVKC